MSTDDRTTPPGRNRTADLERLANCSLLRLIDATGLGGFETWLDPADDLDDVDRDAEGWWAYKDSLLSDLPAYLRREWAARKGAADHASD